jgi:hypothetical protein
MIGRRRSEGRDGFGNPAANSLFSEVPPSTITLRLDACSRIPFSFRPVLFHEVAPSLPGLPQKGVSHETKPRS